jgi:6-phosphogluconolactonase
MTRVSKGPSNRAKGPGVLSPQPDKSAGPVVVVVDDPAAVAQDAARRVRAAALAAIAARGCFRLSLSGGATPRALYAQLAAETAAIGFDWARIQIYFGDERCVPPQHADSNFGMVRAALLDRINIPAANIHRLRGEESDPGIAAALYGRELQLPIDLALLGLGADGHTASLFPGTTVLDETLRMCAAVVVPTLNTKRLTLTLPVFLEARDVLFLVTGSGKSAILNEVVRGPLRPAQVPAQTVARRVAPVTILCDRAAAAGVLKTP